VPQQAVIPGRESGAPRALSSSDPVDSDPVDIEVRALLEKILLSPGFRNSERMRRFLRTSVERTLDGATDQLKEFALGHDVFDRGEGYDPRTDSIVRVEARRLRKKLRAYYEGEGLLDKIVIQFHPGKYIPSFSPAAPGSPHETVAETETLLDPKTVAVLPFSNLSSDPEQIYFCDGISEDIIDALSTVRDLRVLGRGATFMLRDPAMDPREIGASLSAGTIVEGSVRKSGGMLRVAARLIDTQTGHVRWSTTVDRPETDVFAIKDEIATAITATLCDQVSAGMRLPVPAPSIEAYALYLKGRHAANQLDAEDYRKAIDYYSRAIAQFPDYAPPYSGMADVYTAITSWSMARPSSVMPLAKRAAEEALRLDPGLAHAYTSLGWVKFCYEWNWSEGLALARKALLLEPNYAYGHMALGAFYMVLGLVSEGRKELQHSLRLNPLSIRAHRLLGLVLTLEGRFEESDQRLRAARALMPDSCELAWMMAAVYMAQGRAEEGLRYARECQTDPPTPRMLAMLGEALARAGQEKEARKILDRLEKLSAHEFVDPWSFCRLYVALGENDKAIHFLEHSFEERSTLALFAAVDPALNPIRKDPRFQHIISRLHLPANPRSMVAKL
jgi:TolB-like protein/tetratricopeptide (TPR) repeat protein